MCKTDDVIHSNLDSFISSSRTTEWLTGDVLSVFVRKGIRKLDDSILHTLDVANINTIPDVYKGKGYFKSFMLKVESIGLPVYVENIHNPLLTQMLIKHGYSTREEYGVVNAWKII